MTEYRHTTQPELQDGKALLAQSSTASKARAHHLNTTITSMKFILFAQPVTNFLELFSS